MKSSFLKSIFFLLLILTSNLGMSQGWEESYVHVFGAAKAFDVIETTDNHYIMVGDLDLPTGAIRHHVWAVKTDQSGNEIWSRIYGYYNVSYQSANAIAETTDGDLLIAGSDGFTKASVMKINADSDSLWTKYFGGNGGENTFNGIIKTEGGDFILVGQYESDQNTNLHEVWAMGMNAAGDSLWSATYFTPTTAQAVGMDISPLGSNRYLLTGTFEGKGFAIEIDETGNEQWANTYQLSLDDIFLAGAKKSDADQLLIGGTSSGFAGYAPSLLITESTGNNEQVLILPDINFGAVSDILPTGDGGFLLTGSSYEFYNQGAMDIGFIVKLDTDFEVEWEINFSDSSNIQGAAISETSDGGLIMAGSNGGTMFLKKIGGTTNTIDKEKDLLLDVKCYPNPTREIVYFEIPEHSFKQKLSIRFFDAKGVGISQFPLDDPTTMINVATFPKGFYQYIIYENGEERVSGKLILQ